MTTFVAYVTEIAPPDFAPEVDDLTTFDNPRDAWSYLAERAAWYEADDADGQATRAQLAHHEQVPGTVYGPSPGWHDTEREDPGLFYTVAVAPEPSPPPHEVPPVTWSDLESFYHEHNHTDPRSDW